MMFCCSVWIAIDDKLLSVAWLDSAMLQQTSARTLLSAGGKMSRSLMVGGVRVHDNGVL
jgi:hypothetical protein